MVETDSYEAAYLGVRDDDLIEGEIYSIEDSGTWYLFIDGGLRELSTEESKLMFERLDEVLH